VKAEHLELSKLKKAELYDFMKVTRDKEEYRRASAIKQKLEGLPYRTIATNLDVNYRNVYNWIKKYKEYGLDGIRSKRKNAGRIPKVSSDKNKERIKEIISKSPRTFGYLKNTWSIRLLATYLTTILGMNVSPMQTWRIVHDLGIVSRRPKLALEHAEDYEKKKKIVDNYKKVSAALLKKNSPGIRRRDLAKPSAIHNQYIHDERRATEDIS
jgi:transposase